jgi:hypothetical protein
MSFMCKNTILGGLRWLAPLLLGMALVGCERYRPLPNCGSLTDEGIGTGWTVDEASGTATHVASGLVWYRCLAGERFSAGQCTGFPMELMLDDAKDYAKSIAETSGKPWRMPTLKEMQQLRLTHCHNPAVNKVLFPSVNSSNHWTSSVSRNGPKYGCATNTFNGNGYCREAAREELPFFLVIGTEK